MKKTNKKRTSGVVSQATPEIPQPTAPRPRLRDLPESIPITDRARCISVLNREALLDAMARAIFANDTTIPAGEEMSILPNLESA